ncbi:MAG: DUF6132 family protein [Fastidiosipilaceae bacterium]
MNYVIGLVLGIAIGALIGYISKCSGGT